MAKYYDKTKLKDALEIENIFDLLVEFGGDPEYTDFGIISQTICHNLPNEGSRKLYYYEDSGLFFCYTGGCDEPSFDIFELAIKVARNQKNQEWELYDAMRYIAEYFGFMGEAPKEEDKELADWDILKRHDIASLSFDKDNIKLKEYNPIILTRFQYPRLIDWELEGIDKQVYRENFIGYYPGAEQITIPHFDINNRLIGIRGRATCKQMADKFGKYRPLTICGNMYSHPLSMNLYHLNKTKDNIARAKAAIIFEGEKSTLQYASFYGAEQDISVACCGSNISSYQIDLLTSLGAQEIIIAFDRQFQDIGDDEFKKLTKKITLLYNKYKHEVRISAIFDKTLMTGYKCSPTDCGKEVFETLLNNRIRPK